MKWTTRGDGHEHARYHGMRLRIRHVPTGWIISRRDYDGWLFVAGDVRREIARTLGVSSSAVRMTDAWKNRVKEAA